jgi:hypothetical protein
MSQLSFLDKTAGPEHIVDEQETNALSSTIGLRFRALAELGAVSAG